MGRRHAAHLLATHTGAESAEQSRLCGRDDCRTLASPRPARIRGHGHSSVRRRGRTVKVESSATVPLTFVPAFPIYPPETAWMRQPKTELPGLLLTARARRGPGGLLTP